MDTAKKASQPSPHLISPRALYLACCIFFCSLYFVRDILGIGISYYVISAAAALIMAILPHEYAIIFFVSMFAFSNAGYNGIFSFLMLCVVFARFCRIKYRFNSAILFIIFICLYETVHVFSRGIVAFGVILTYVCLLLSLGILLQYPHSKINKQAALNSFICFSLFFAAMAFFILLKEQGSLSALFTDGYRTKVYTDLATKFSYLLGNQNYLTSLCSLNISICILMYTKTRRLRYLLASLFFIFSGLMTVSKMFIAVFLFLFLYTVLALARKNLVYAFTAVVVFVLIVLVLMLLFSDTLLAMVKLRFATTELTTGRLDIISEMFSYMAAHPHTYLVGTGLLNLEPVLGVAVHSSVFEIIGGWGAVGITLAAGYLISLLLIAHKNARLTKSRSELLNWLPLLTLLSYSVIGMLFSSAASIAKMTVCIFALEYRKERS